MGKSVQIVQVYKFAYMFFFYSCNSTSNKQQVIEKNSWREYNHFLQHLKHHTSEVISVEQKEEKNLHAKQEGIS